MMTLVLSVQIWWLKALWKALGLVQLVKQFFEAIASQLPRNYTGEARRAPNMISVTHGLLNHHKHAVEYSNVQRREGTRNPLQWAKGNLRKTSTSAKTGVVVERICHHLWVALLWWPITQLFRIRFRRRLYHWKATIFLLHFKPSIADIKPPMAVWCASKIIDG